MASTRRRPDRHRTTICTLRRVERRSASTCTAHVEFLAGRGGQRAEHVAQAGTAQPGVDDQRGDDQVGAGVVQVVGEHPQRVGQRHPGVQPADQRGQRLGQGRRGDPQRGRDGLLQADRAGDRVAQRLGPDGQALQPGHRPALAGRAGEPAPAVGEDGRAHPGYRPPGGHQRHDADQRGHRAARPEDAPRCSASPFRRVPGGRGRKPRIPIKRRNSRRRPPPRTGWPAAGRRPGRSPPPPVS